MNFLGTHYWNYGNNFHGGLVLSYNEVKFHKSFKRVRIQIGNITSLG